MNYGLPVTVDIDGTEYEINTDFRVILDILEALNDPELTGQERGYVSLAIFYKDFEDMPSQHYEGAVAGMFWFIRGGADEPKKQQKRLIDWQQDFQYIIAPVNRIIGHDIRGDEYVHWWTFLGAYMEIGDCLLAQIIRIRSLRAKGKKLDKQDTEWYRDNRELVDFKTTYSDAENELLKLWGGETHEQRKSDI